MNLPGVPSAGGTLCEENDNSEHELLTCSYTRVGAEKLLRSQLYFLKTRQFQCSEQFDLSITSS